MPYEIGQRVKVHHFEGTGREYLREGEIVGQEGKGRRVRAIGLDILFEEKDMEPIE